MTREYFVEKHSIVRQIWGKGDTILFIFAGAAAEFALNKAVDWLYFTGRLPDDPMGRLFSTVAYARTIVFSEQQTALRAIDSIRAIHSDVEMKRNARIPEWAYRDVLFMLIEYSIRSFELLERKLHQPEKEEVFDVFYRVGKRMGITGLPDTFEVWENMRKDHMDLNLTHSQFTDDLYGRYRLHLGRIRYRILLETQNLITPGKVRKLLGFTCIPLFKLLIGLYKLSRKIGLAKHLRALILPSKYKKAIEAMDHMPMS